MGFGKQELGGTDRKERPPGGVAERAKGNLKASEGEEEEGKPGEAARKGYREKRSNVPRNGLFRGLRLRSGVYGATD